jgi:hypothetical protein
MQHTHTHTHTNTHTHTHTHMYIYTYVRIDELGLVKILYICIIHTNIHTYMHTCIQHTYKKMRHLAFVRLISGKLTTSNKGGIYTYYTYIYTCT